MDAVISGSAGVAVLLSGDTLSFLRVEDPNQVIPSRPVDLAFLFGDSSDLQFIENVDIEHVTQELERAWTCEEALNLSLITLDPGLSWEIRQEAAGALEDLLRNKTIKHGLLNILYAQPLPIFADFSGAFTSCKASGATLVLDLLRDLETHQPQIENVCLCWEAINTSAFTSEEQRALFKSTAIREGLFRDLVMDIANTGKVDTFLFNTLTNPRISSLSQYRNVLLQWVAPFRDKKLRQP